MEKRSVLISGASSGIGLHVAEELAKVPGLRVYAGVRKEADFNRLAEKGIASLRPVYLDVTDPKSVEAVIDHLTLETEYPLYAVVNNAGIALAGPLEYMPVSAMEELFAVNVFGLLRLSQAALPLLRQSRGRLINIGSMAGRVVVPMMGTYSSSKFAVEAISDAFRRELYDDGLRVALVEPGDVVTPIWETSKNRSLNLIANLPVEARTRYGRIIDRLVGNLERKLKKAAQPSEVYTAVFHALFSSRPKSRYVVGKDARMGAVLRHLPDSWFDALLIRTRMR